MKMKSLMNKKSIFAVVMFLSLQGVRSSDTEQGVEQIVLAENNQDIQQQIYGLADTYIEKSTREEQLNKKSWENFTEKPASKALNKYYEEVLHCNDALLEGLDKRVLQDLENRYKDFKNEVLWERGQPQSALSQEEIDQIKLELKKLVLAYIQEKRIKVAEELMIKKAQEEKPKAKEILEQLVNRCKEANVTEEFMLTLPKKVYVAIKDFQDMQNMFTESEDENRWQE